MVRSGFPPISAEWQGSNPAGRRFPHGSFAAGECHLSAAPQCSDDVGRTARCVDDLTLIYNIIKGPSWDSPNTVPSRDARPEQVRVDGLRCAFFTDLNPHPPADPDIKKAAHRAARILAGRGIIVDEIAPPIGDVALENRRYYGADGQAAQSGMVRCGDRVLPAWAAEIYDCGTCGAKPRPRISSRPRCVATSFDATSHGGWSAIQ